MLKKPAGKMKRKRQPGDSDADESDNQLDDWKGRMHVWGRTKRTVSIEIGALS